MYHRAVPKTEFFKRLLCIKFAGIGKFRVRRQGSGMEKKQSKDVDDFWRKYEEKTGERVLVKSLGQYVSGWKEFDDSGVGALWGLVIATDGGFRFHHFPRSGGWLDFLTNFGPEREAPREKTLFVPRDRILSVELRRETKWWKKVFSPAPPLLVINYRNGAEEEQNLLFRIEHKTEGLVEGLTR
jgi:hypothetical protein